MPGYDNGKQNSFSKFKLWARESYIQLLKENIIISVWTHSEDFSHTCLQRVTSDHMEAVLSNYSRKAKKRQHPQGDDPENKFH